MNPNRGGRRRAQVVRRRPRASLMALVIAIGVLGPSAMPAQAAPIATLQAVGVRLAADGSITSIVSETVSSSGGSRIGSSRQDLDTASWGPKLPLRVQTTYAHDGHQGTDLADLEGMSGRFVIELALLNTSVHPQIVTTGSGDQFYMLTGVPLTVLATATFGPGAQGTVVTTAGSGEPRTNGISTHSDPGRVQVRYAASLVPPAMPATARFTLVVDSDRFAVPAFNIAVQAGVSATGPGSNVIEAVLASDTSAEQLMLVTQMDQVTTTLHEVREVLGRMNTELGTASSDLTGPVLAGLASGSERLVALMNGLAQRLQSSSGCLQDVVRAVVGPTADTATGISCRAMIGQPPGNVQSRVADVLKSLRGLMDGPTPKAATLDGVSGCRLAATGSPAQGASLIGQARVLQEWASALGEASAQCQQVIVDRMRALIGTSNDLADGSCARSSGLVCSLTRAEDAMTQVEETQRSALIASLKAAFPQRPLADLGTALARLEQSWPQLDPRQVADLDGLLTSRDPNAPGILEIAEHQVNALGAGDGALLDRARAIESSLREVCSGLPPTPAVPISALDEVVSRACDPTHLNMVGPDRTDVPEADTVPGALVADLERERARWQEVVVRASAMRDALSGLLNTTDADKALEGIRGAYDALMERGAVFDEAVSTSAARYADAVANAAGDALRASTRAAVDAEAGAAAEVRDLFTAFSTTTSLAGDDAANRWQSAADALKGRISGLEDSLSTQLSGAAAEVIADIARSYEAALGDPQETNGTRGIQNRLARDFAVLLDALRGDGSGGLVGLLAANLGSSRGAANYVEHQYSTASEEVALRSVSARRSQAMQQGLGETLSRRLGGFGISSRAGSQVMPVFTYQVGGNR